MDGPLSDSRPGAAAYRDALDYLFARTAAGIRPGLGRTTALLELLGNPHQRVPAFHVAGTNGKGSTVATIAAILRGRGLRVATYTSPHLVDFRERIVVDRVPVPEEAVVDFVHRWTPEVERLGATFFEATTALAFDWFARAGADVSVIETGLGGRLDSTNVLTPLAAGVSTVGLDHVDVLGETREAIAREKAGIFKPGVPAVIGDLDPAVQRVLAAEAERIGARSVCLVAGAYRVSDVRVGDGTCFHLAAPWGDAEPRTPLIGRHQAFNTAFALAMLDAAGPAHRVRPPDLEALADVHLPGRFDRRGQFLFDVAHNEDGVRVLVDALAAVQRPLVAVVCVLGDKAWQPMLARLAAVVDALVLTDAPTAPRERRWPLAEALAFARAHGARAVAIPELESALAHAAADAATVLVTGSFHTVGDAMRCLQLDPLAG